MSIWDGWGSYTLSEEGQAQAAKAAQWLSFEKIGRAFSSDVPRTMQTAQHLMDTGAVMCPYLSCDPNLRARNVGIFTGKEKTAERLAEFKRYIDDPSLVIPEGESGDQFNQRIQVLFQYLVTPYEALPTAFFLHNSTIKAIMGLSGIKDAVTPGGIIAVFMDERGDISFEIVLGEMNDEKGVS